MAAQTETGAKRKFPRLRYIPIAIAVIVVLLGIKRFMDSSNHFKRGEEFYAQEMIDEAIAEWERAARLNPWSVRTFSNLSLLYMRTGLYGKAFESAKKAVELKPDYESALVVFGKASFHLGRMKEKEGNKEEARTLYEKGIESYKKALGIAYAPDTIHYLGTAYLCLGQYDEGIMFFTEQMPDNTDAAEEVDKLTAIKKRFLAGAGPSRLVGADTWGPLPFGAEIAVVGHPVFTFTEGEKGEFQNGIFYPDLDGDKESELVLIYKMPLGEGFKPCFVSVFEWSQKKWVLRWNTRLGGSDVGYFTVEDINADGKPEIVVEVIHDMKSGAILNIYGWTDSAYKTVQQIGPTWGTTLIDMDGDGAKEIVILDRKHKEYKSLTYQWDGTRYVQMK